MHNAPKLFREFCGKYKSSITKEQEMRLKIFFIATIIVTALFSCSRQGHKAYSPSLLALEDSLDANPQEALNQILDIDTSSLSKHDNILYHFLLIKSKQLIPSAPDVLASNPDLVISYFKENKDSVRLCQTYFYLGRIYFNRYAFLRANASYNQAEKYAGQNIRMLFAIKIGEAHIYRFKMMHNMEETCLERALYIANGLNDSALMAEALHEFAELRISEKKYVLAGSNLRKALSLVSQNNSPARAEYNKDLGRVYLAMNKPDSALLYTNVALQNGYLDEPACNILKGNIYLKMHRLEDAEQLFMKYIGKLPLNERHDIYYKMSLLKKEQGDFQSACKYAEKSIRTRDSLEANNKAGYISNLNAFQEHERQQKRIAQMNAELSEQELSYYRLAILLSFILLLGITGFFHTNQKKKKTEVKYLKEKRDREAIEIESLNQSVEYYRRLNALTVPILMKSQNSQGAMHLKKEEWDIIVQNTDACFNDFTMRLKNAYPELTVEEIRFACLLKMEFSLSLLSEIYHIAKGSISRKKMRLKEKMKIENMTLDDFIKQF